MRVGVVVSVAVAAASSPGVAWVDAGSRADSATAATHLVRQADCASSRYRQPASPAYANTTWPSEHADVWRSHAAPTGLPPGVGRMRLRT